MYNKQEPSKPFHAVDETFLVYGDEIGQENFVLVKVVESDDCNNCVFRKGQYCLRRGKLHGSCHSPFRKDRINVKFVPVGEQQDDNKLKMNAKEV